MRIIKPINHKSSGFTLIELLIASVLGIVVIGSVITVFATTVRYNSDNLQMIRLNQELRGVMSLISRDLKRAGYFNSAAVTTTYLDTFGGTDTGFYGYNDCVYFAYDIDADGLDTDITPPSSVYDDASDFIAYKLASGEIKQGKGTNDAIDTPGSFSCTNNISWEAITEYAPGTDDRSDIQITQLQFEPECSIAGGAVASDFICTGTGVEVRNMVITITGQVITPVDNTVVSRTLTETIKLRNDSGV
tara:strand:- start:3695 stop:4435 length:741 start_codon:yes stop_codon:yes gene_type:complete